MDPIVLKDISLSLVIKTNLRNFPLPPVIGIWIWELLPITLPPTSHGSNFIRNLPDNYESKVAWKVS